MAAMTIENHTVMTCALEKGIGGGTMVEVVGD